MTSNNNFGVILFSSLGSFAFGYALSAVSGIIGLPGFIDYFDLDINGPKQSYANAIQGGKFTRGRFQEHS